MWVCIMSVCVYVCVVYIVLHAETEIPATGKAAKPQVTAQLGPIQAHLSK